MLANRTQDGVEDFCSKIHIRPMLKDPVPPQYHAVEIVPPWDTEGYLTLRFPETLHSNLGLLFIDHYRSDMLPVVDLQKLPDWQVDPDTDALLYNCELPNKVEFSGRITPGPDELELEFTVKNGTDTELSGLGTQFCLVQTPCPTFSIPELINTYILHDGKWLSLSDSTFKKSIPDRPPWIIGSVKDKPGPKPGASHPDAWYVCHELSDAPLHSHSFQRQSPRPGHSMAYRQKRHEQRLDTVFTRGSSAAELSTGGIRFC